MDGLDVVGKKDGNGLVPPQQALHGLVSTAVSLVPPPKPLPAPHPPPPPPPPPPHPLHQHHHPRVEGPILPSLLVSVSQLPPHPHHHHHHHHHPPIVTLHNRIQDTTLPQQKKTKPCRICGKMFARESNLRRHEKTHSKEAAKEFKCDLCPIAFAREEDLKSHHLRIHKNQSPFTCDVCKKSFSRRSNLRAHRKVHSGVKDNICGECGRAFARPSDLRRHQRIHLSQKPFRCPQCNKSFSQSGYLKRHQAVHDPVKEHCPTCGKSFNWPENLKTHMMTHHPSEPKKFPHTDMTKKLFVCEVPGCDKIYKRQGDLKRHDTVAHGIPHNGNNNGSTVVVGQPNDPQTALLSGGDVVGSAMVMGSDMHRSL